MQTFNSPLEAFLYWEEHTPDRVFLNQPINGKVITYTFFQAGEESRKIASSLKALSLPEQSHIALLSKNCAHWIIADLAIMMCGYVSIPIYPTLNAEAINQILIHSESKAIIIGKLDDYKSQKKGIQNIPKISIGLYGVEDGELWEDILLKEKRLEQVHIKKPNDLHTIIYTSGTTGMPKGVMHSVSNFMKSANTGIDIFKIPNHCKCFSYLPLAHVAERIVTGTCGVVVGAEFYFPESLETFASDLENCQPYLFFAVPRIWSKFQEKILSSVPQKKLTFLLKIPIVNSIIKNKLKKKLGLKQAQVILSGAAPLSESIIHWYKTLGITILQAYGMTEDCIISHSNLHEANKIGTVGKAIKGVRIKFSSIGEICIKNDCLMSGYYKLPEVTASVFDHEGYFKTGDIGEYDHDGFLTITGRVKDQFKTDKGKYISPAPIELALSKNTDIEQICIVGTGIPQPIALITLSELGRKKNKADLSAGLIETVHQLNPSLEKHEKIEKIIIMKEDWNVDNGLTTPTLKVKRNAIEKIHQEFYKSWFEDSDKVIFE
ncbi:AMP-binding protein [Lacinutrix iliipiscaria]|uniref:AMP-binding protein n=1 Tax=Lacinutrix iliipiscaria TaxID=1230532 RepID=A0ABW5WN33_9FLAO